jgi:hypothetical protein
MHWVWNDPIVLWPRPHFQAIFCLPWSRWECSYKNSNYCKWEVMDIGLQKKDLNILCLLFNHNRVLDHPLVIVLLIIYRSFLSLYWVLHLQLFKIKKVYGVWYIKNLSHFYLSHFVCKWQKVISNKHRRKKSNEYLKYNTLI